MSERSSEVVVAVRGGELPLDLARTAVIVVDMQNDFASPGGMFDRGGVDCTGLQAIIEPTARVLEAARARDCHVVYLVMGMPAALAEMVGAGVQHAVLPAYGKRIISSMGTATVAPDGSPSAVNVEGTWNTAIVDGLTPQPDDTIVAKPLHSGFYDTELHDRLQALGVEHLVFTGGTTSICVESTVRDAFWRGYRCLVVEDCVAEPIGADLPRTNHDASLDLIEKVFGWVTHSDAFVAALAPHHRASASKASS